MEQLERMGELTLVEGEWGLIWIFSNIILFMNKEQALESTLAVQAAKCSAGRGVPCPIYNPDCFCP